MKVKELRQAMAGVAGDMDVAMADGISVVFAQVAGGVFVISDVETVDDKPVEYRRAAKSPRTS
ncbi:MAG: hypothetical protein ABSA96_21000 [Candidatus Acidiferrales bacterium]|jgi:hypothetical protein